MFDPSTTTTFVGSDLAGVMGCLRRSDRSCPRSARGSRRRRVVGRPRCHRRVAARDPSGTLGLRRRHPLQPFEAFRRYEAAHEIPLDFIRGVNATNPDVNAWARLERAELDHEGFDAAFAAESKALGHEVPGADVLALLAGDVRSDMVTALDGVIAAGYKTACLTNNVVRRDGEVEERPEVAAVMARFDVVVESSKVGIRKPELGFYRRACELLASSRPSASSSTTSGST